MIEVPTVLVLGAGASSPFGYPLASELHQDIVTKLNDQESKLFRFLGTEHTPKHIEAFNVALRYSPGSLDAFLEHRYEEFGAIGKQAIAFELVQYESTDRLFGHTGEGNWYEYLFKRMVSEGFGEFGNNQLSVITYNYDRSLECYLYTALRHHFGKRMRECFKQLSRISIVHVHGTLGYLPWQWFYRPPSVRSAPSRELMRPYSPLVASRAIMVCADLIRVVHEGADHDQEYQQARKLLRNAERIFFLGFGYDPTNVGRLRPDELDQEYQLRGSAFGLKKAECNIKLGLLAKGARRQLCTRLGNIQHRVLDFLRNCDIQL